jgi:hypothetical protein
MNWPTEEEKREYFCKLTNEVIFTENEFKYFLFGAQECEKLIKAKNPEPDLFNGLESGDNEQILDHDGRGGFKWVTRKPGATE